MSRRGRTRLQRLKHSFVVTFSAAAAAGSAGCDALAEPSEDDGARSIPPSGPVAGGVPVTPFVPLTPNPPFVNPERMPPCANCAACPSTQPAAGGQCMPTSQPACTYPANFGGCPSRATARCMENLWVVEIEPVGCNPPPPVLSDGGTEVEEDAGLDDDAGLDVDS